MRNGSAQYVEHEEQKSEVILSSESDENILFKRKFTMKQEAYEVSPKAKEPFFK